MTFKDNCVVDINNMEKKHSRIISTHLGTAINITTLIVVSVNVLYNQCQYKNQCIYRSEFFEYT